MNAIEKALTCSYGTAFAVLRKQVNDVALVEDALQHASLKAIEHWQSRLPMSSKAWLIKVATNFIRDHYKKHKPDYQATIEFVDPQNSSCFYEDAVLELIFTCCHPSLAIESQLVIILKWVMGFDNASIARALLITEKTLEQRLTRTKRKISANQIDLTPPSKQHVKMRLDAALQALYLIFNEGYYNNAGNEALSLPLCEQAIYLTRVLSRSYRGHSNTLALLALMLFIHARSPARSYTNVVLLAHQDRSLWLNPLITQADVLLQKALKIGRAGKFHIEAAIAGLHSLAPNYAATDWQQIVMLYEKLLEQEYSAIYLLNQSTALMQIAQWQKAENNLLKVTSALKSYPPLYVALAHLFASTDRITQASENLKIAISLSKNTIEKRYLQDRLNHLSADDMPTEVMF